MKRPVTQLISLSPDRFFARASTCVTRLESGFTLFWELLSEGVQTSTQRPSIGDLVIGVINGEVGTASKPDRTDGMIVCRKPEITQFYIFVLDLAVFRPKGRILSGLCLDPHHREVFPVYPDCPTIKKFALRFWLNRDCVP